MFEAGVNVVRETVDVRGGVDCDVHNTVPAIEALYPYLSERWRDYVVEHGVTSLEPNYYPANTDLASHPDAMSSGGSVAGSDVDLVREQVLDSSGISHAILNCLYGVQLVHNEDWALEMARAVNDWQRAEWLEKDERFRASILVPVQNPELAVEEIDRLGDHPGFVQVLMFTRSELTLGRRHYWPIYEAAQRNGLVIGLHAGGAPRNPITPVGWPSYYIEDYASHAQAFQSQLVSLITEGVFSKYPALRVAFIESGFTWLPSLMWRLDKNWKGLRREVPWVDRLPSEIVHEHVRFTIQPTDGPQNGEFLLQVVEQLGSEDLLLYSSDYPHWHYEESENVLLASVSDGLKEKILFENARTLYGI